MSFVAIPYTAPKKPAGPAIAPGGPSVGRQHARAQGLLPAMRILLVEDEFLLADQLEEDLRELGCTVVGPFASLGEASDAARASRFDLAVLDINLNGEMVYPLADALSARGVPFIFLSGYLSDDLPERFRTAPQIAKPYDLAALTAAIRRAAPKSG